jgi:hypothetical protein
MFFVCMADKAKLTLKQELFVEAYLGAAKGNATEAARLAGYKGSDQTLAQVGAENLRKPHIAALIGKRVETEAMEADEVLQLLSDHARASLADFLTFPDNGRSPFVDLAKAQKLGKLHLIKKLDTHELTGTVKTIWLHDAQSALALLGKYHKLFVDQVDVTSKGNVLPVLNIYASETGKPHSGD